MDELVEIQKSMNLEPILGTLWEFSLDEITNPSQGDMHIHIHVLTDSCVNSAYPIHLPACFRKVEGNPKNPDGPTWKWETKYGERCQPGVQDFFLKRKCKP